MTLQSDCDPKPFTPKSRIIKLGARNEFRYHLVQLTPYQQENWANREVTYPRPHDSLVAQWVRASQV